MLSSLLSGVDPDARVFRKREVVARRRPQVFQGRCLQHRRLLRQQRTLQVRPVRTTQGPRVEQGEGRLVYEKGEPLLGKEVGEFPWRL